MPVRAYVIMPTARTLLPHSLPRETSAQNTKRKKIRKRKSIDDLPPLPPLCKDLTRGTRFALSEPRLRTQCPIPTCYPYARSVFTRRNDPATSRTGKTGKPGGSHFLAPFPQTLHSGGAFRLVGRETSSPVLTIRSPSSDAEILRSGQPGKANKTGKTRPYTSKYR